MVLIPQMVMLRLLVSSMVSMAGTSTRPSQLFGLLVPFKKWHGQSPQTMAEDMLCDSARLMLRQQRNAFNAIICHSMAILLGLSWVAVMNGLKSKQTEPPRARIQVARSGPRFPFHHVVVLLVAVWDAMQDVLSHSFLLLSLDFGETAQATDVLVVIPMLTLTINQFAIKK
jgi:hypothetical protein